MKTFIEMPSIAFNWMVQRPQQIMKRLSRNNLVYYIEKNDKSYIYNENNNLHILGGGYNFTNLKLNSPVILWCSSPLDVLNIKKIPHDYVVYDVVDEASNELKGWRDYINPMLSEADIVVTASNYLYDKFKKLHPKVYLVKNAVDLDNFKKVKNAMPSDMPMGKPIIGYTGAIASWLDEEILKYIVKDNRYNFVFVGPSINKYKPSILRSNVYFLGAKPYEELPYYINNFQCAIIPFKNNELIAGCNPIKFYEYLSLGKSVVCTNISELREYDKYCYISKTKEEFLKNIEASIETEKDEKKIKERINLAQTNSWESRVNLIEQIIDRGMIYEI